MNASPSLDFDVMRATDLFGGPFTPPGFYYKTFIRPRRLWPLYEKVLRHAAGLGRLRAAQPEREWRTEYRRRHADVLVVGGGAAGLSAAIAAAELGADVVLATRAPSRAGGCSPRAATSTRASSPRARASAGVEVLVERARAGRLRRPRAGLAGRHAAPGPRRRASSTPPARSSSRCCSPATTCPGVMLSGGARRLAALYGVSPGTRAVVATVCDRGLEAALGAASTRASSWPPWPTCASSGGARALERADAPRRARRCAARPCSRRAGAATCQGVGARQPGAATATASALRLRPARGVRRQRAGHLAARAGGRAAPPTTRERGVLRARRELPDGVYAAGEVAGRGRARGRRALGRGGRRRGARTRSASATTSSRARAERARAARRADGAAARGRRAPAGDERARAASASPACART